MRSRAGLAFATGIAAVFATVSVGTAAAAQSDVCAARPSGIPAAALAAGVPSRGCGGLAGDTVVSPSGAAVSVPVDGTTGAEVLTTTGAEILTVRNVRGVVTATDERTGSGAGVAAPAGAEPLVAAAPLACSQTAYNYEHATDHWVGAFYWYYNSSTQSRSGLSGTGVLDAIRQGNQNMALNHNDCGNSGQFRAYGNYNGDTGRFANIDSTTHCTAKFPDGQNAVSWGPFDSSHSGTLAETCWHSNSSGQFTEADIYFGSNSGIRVGIPSGCSGSYDLESVGTHEWGHAYGMAHETSGQWETMYPVVDSCTTYWRTLGQGDTTGMARLYGYR